MNKSSIVIAILMLAIGLLAGYWFSDGKVEPAQPSASKAAQPLFYRNPMNPAITSPVPTKDSMGMDYVPVFANAAEGNDSAGTVSIDPVMVQNIGVRTAIAKRASLSRSIRALGRVAFDERRIVNLHPKVEGWIDEIRIDKTGQQVKSDDILLSIYSPNLVSTQQEYLLALNNRAALKGSPLAEISKGAESLVTSARQRLEMQDVAEHQIRELEQTRQIKKNLHIHAPTAGTVIRIGARQGQYVTPATELYMLVDLSQVWVFADVYEYELPWIKVGDQVAMTLASVPGKTFVGKLDYIYPYAETKTRTIKVRLVFDNPELLLRPDMFAEVIIRADTQADAVVIPAEAVIRSGSQDQVFLVLSPGKFTPRIVTLGLESAGQVEVLKGLEAGDEIVTSAQFLVDSESKLSEATSKMLGLMAPVITTTETPANDTEHSLHNASSRDIPVVDQEVENPDHHGAHQHD
ncbi:MAG: efflux RND transporter periplasmic adaptor subunit [Pseudomonadales bacterium]|nr:efflux RND transporter periplasmic adaptor subunit [Pseudomonadales bacterium]